VQAEASRTVQGSRCIHGHQCDSFMHIWVEQESNFLHSGPWLWGYLPESPCVEALTSERLVCSLHHVFTVGPSEYPERETKPGG
jgi:hypothetical protein